MEQGKIDLEKEFQETNISILWHKNLYDSLTKIQNYLRVCRDGATDIIEWLQISPTQLAEVKFQFLKMLVTEMELIIINAKPKLPKDFLKKMKIYFSYVNERIRKEKILIQVINQQTNTASFVLGDEYYSIVSMLQKSYEKIVETLSDILFGKPQEKIPLLKKTKSIPFMK